jgi:hypothetical protein|eukprot:1686340-Prymnesium_polylepis.2
MQRTSADFAWCENGSLCAGRAKATRALNEAKCYWDVETSDECERDALHVTQWNEAARRAGQMYTIRPRRNAAC